MNYPTMALSAHWHTYPDRFAWIAEHGFALEYSPNPEGFDLLPRHLDALLKAGVPVRHHAFFPGYEIGHADAEGAERALRVHLAALEALQGHGEPVLTNSSARKPPPSGVGRKGRRPSLSGSNTTLALAFCLLYNARIRTDVRFGRDAR